jgi:hypothetical protein
MLNLFTSLIQQYPSSVVIAAFVCGGCIGFLAAALCAVAHDADAHIAASNAPRAKGRA